MWGVRSPPPPTAMLVHSGQARMTFARRPTTTTTTKKKYRSKVLTQHCERSQRPLRHSMVSYSGFLLYEARQSNAFPEPSMAPLVQLTSAIRQSQRNKNEGRHRHQHKAYMVFLQMQEKRMKTGQKMSKSQFLSGTQ